MEGAPSAQLQPATLSLDEVMGRIIRPLFDAYLERQRQKLELGMLKSGQISPTEYLERVAKEETRRLDRARRW